MLDGIGPGLIPARAGIGLRSEHYADILATLPAVGWLEVHPENYFGEGGKPLYFLEKIRSHYPLSLHGVGLSLGSTDALNSIHLEKLKRLKSLYWLDLKETSVSAAAVDDLKKALPKLRYVRTSEGRR